MTNHWWLYKWGADLNIWRCYPRWVISLSVILKSDGNGVFLSRISTVPLYNGCNSFVDVAEARDQTGRQYVIWDRIMERRNTFAAGRDTWIWMSKITKVIFYPIANFVDVWFKCSMTINLSRDVWILRKVAAFLQKQNFWFNSEEHSNCFGCVKL